MQRIFNIDKWTLLPTGKAIHFNGDTPRKVVLEVNASDPTKLILVREKGSSFLARVCGRDTVEFYVDGSFGLANSGADCFVYTVDGVEFTFTDVENESYTVVRDRQERNYELELITARMMENMSRRLEQQAHEIEASLERRAAERQARLAKLAGETPSSELGEASGSDAGSPAGSDGETPKRGPGRPRKRVEEPTG